MKQNLGNIQFGGFGAYIKPVSRRIIPIVKLYYQLSSKQYPNTNEPL